MWAGGPAMVTSCTSLWSWMFAHCPSWQRRAWVISKVERVAWSRMTGERKYPEPEDLKPMPGRNDVRVMDVRHAEEHASGLLPEAEPYRSSDRWNTRNRSPKDRIITVCTNGGGPSAQAAQVLHHPGFGRAFRSCGGGRWGGGDRDRWSGRPSGIPQLRYCPAQAAPSPSRSEAHPCGT